MDPIIIAGLLVALGCVLLGAMIRGRPSSARRTRLGGGRTVPRAPVPKSALRGARTVALADGGTITLRLGAPGDAARVAALANALDREVSDGSEPHTAETVREDMLGGAAGLVLWVAAPVDPAGTPPANADVVAGEPVAYALVQDMYDTDSASWASWLHDLYVEADWRDRKVGAHLMAHLAEMARAAGHSGLWWGVHRNNLRAESFYRSLDAHCAPIHVMGVSGPTLEALAAKAV